ncbi:helix-turn-helix transcriptional regulator [Parafilimonas sp.]|uniref:helix-turn-helix transcriptional regulator n=1 Tax=Parafilimonas sp. TaxID=1969739 RepID=UPI0039E6892F
MNRIDRLSAILIQLQSKRLVKAQHIADKFSISLRTVYRDMHALQESGVPIIGEAGTGYSLMEGYKLPPVMFTQDETSALLTAAKLMQSKTDKRSAQHYNAALDKIKAVLRFAEKDHIEEIDEHVAVMEHPAFQYERPEELYLQPILKAIASKNVVDITYKALDGDKITCRKIEPVGIYNLGNYWHLIAFCRMRNDYRNFRTDRIEKFVCTDETVLKIHPPLQQFINKMSAQREVIRVIIEVRADIIKYFGEQKYYNGFVKEEDAGNSKRLTFLTGSLTGFARWFMLFGDHAKIIEPFELNDMVAQIAENILKKIEMVNL